MDAQRHLVHDGKPYFNRHVGAAVLLFALYSAAGIALVYLASHPGAEALALLGHVRSLSSLRSVALADQLSLLNGAVTVLALCAVLIQIGQAASEGKERSAQQMHEAALRADQLHAEYNSAEMQWPRVVAYEYLKFLKRNDTLLEEFARNWVRDDDDDCPVPAKSHAKGTALTFSDYSAALDAMIAFFVRVSSHVSTHERRLASGEGDRHQMIGPFFWSYWWRAGMEELVNACEKAHAEPANIGRYDRPYFIDALRELQRIYCDHGAPGTRGGDPGRPVAHSQVVLKAGSLRRSSSPVSPQAGGLSSGMATPTDGPQAAPARGPFGKSPPPCTERRPGR